MRVGPLVGMLHARAQIRFCVTRRSRLCAPAPPGAVQSMYGVQYICSEMSG